MPRSSPLSRPASGRCEHARPLGALRSLQWLVGHRSRAACADRHRRGLPTLVLAGEFDPLTRLAIPEPARGGADRSPGALGRVSSHGAQRQHAASLERQPLPVLAAAKSSWPSSTAPRSRSTRRVPIAPRRSGFSPEIAERSSIGRTLWVKRWGSILIAVLTAAIHRRARDELRRAADRDGAIAGDRHPRQFPFFGPRPISISPKPCAMAGSASWCVRLNMGSGRSPRRRPHEPGHALFVRDLRSGRGAGDDPRFLIPAAATCRCR